MQHNLKESFMKTLVAFLFSLFLALSFSTAAYAHCGSCGPDVKPHGHKELCEKKCKDSKTKDECMKKCEKKHNDDKKKKEKEKK